MRCERLRTPIARCVCREALGQVDSALQDFKAALIEQPNNKEAAERIDHLVQLTMQTLPADEPLDQ